MKDYAVLRFNALKELGQRKAERFYQEGDKKITDYFGINVFDRDKMRAYLTAEAYDAVIAAIDEGKKIDRKVADQIASGIKTWAVERGATHYTSAYSALPPVLPPKFLCRRQFGRQPYGRFSCLRQWRQ